MILAFVSPHRAHDIITFTCKNIFLYRFDSIIFMSVYFCINITRYMSFIKHTFFILLNFDFVYLLFGFFNFCFFFPILVWIYWNFFVCFEREKKRPTNFECMMFLRQLQFCWSANKKTDVMVWSIVSYIFHSIWKCWITVSMDRFLLD